MRWGSGEGCGWVWCHVAVRRGHLLLLPLLLPLRMHLNLGGSVRNLLAPPRRVNLGEREQLELERELRLAVALALLLEAFPLGRLGALLLAFLKSVYYYHHQQY